MARIKYYNETTGKWEYADSQYMNVDLSGYATTQFVRDGFQPKGNYLKEEDKSQIVSDVLAALPTWTGGSY